MSVSAESSQIPAAMLRAIQPAGAVFALGWVMAELFDPRRRASVTVVTPPFNPDTQLPLVADLAADRKLVFLAAKATELLQWFPDLQPPLGLVTRQTDKKKAAIAQGNPATAGAAKQADHAVPVDHTTVPADGNTVLADGNTVLADDTVLADNTVQQMVATAAIAEADFSETDFLAAVTGLHQAILDELAQDSERLSAYQLGLALSDLTWLPFIAATGQDSPASRPSALLSLFARPNLATVQTLLSSAGTQLPSGAATIVSRSINNWADWIDVNSGRIKSPGADVWGPNADTVLRALRVQGSVWQSVLIADPDVAVQPSMGAWVQAGSSILRAAREVSWSILRRFWPLVVLGLVTLGGLLYLVISNLNGVAQVWASLATVAAVLGSGTWGVSSGISSSLSGIEYDIWSAAKLDAAAWDVTWLPALKATVAERARLDQRGVATPQVRQNLDIP